MPSEEIENGDIQFEWGKRKGVGNTNKDVKFYESFIYDGDNYLLYDNVYLFKEGNEEPYVGKILKIWEQPGQKRRVKVLWFFRASDIQAYLGGHTSSKKELFLASGEGDGLFNVNPLEAIAGKCNVVCTSRDERNAQPSSVAIEKADFTFYRIFDVGTCTVSERLPEKIAGAEVEYLLNRPNDQKPDLYVKSEPVDSGPLDDKPVKKYNQGVDSVKLPLDQQKICDPDSGGLIIKSDVGSPGTGDKAVGPVDDLVKTTLENQNNEIIPRKRKFISEEDSPDSDSFKLSKGSSQMVELSDGRNKFVDALSQNASSAALHRSKWFGNMPWKTRLEKAHTQGRLVFLDNLDPSYSSSEIEDVLRGALKVVDCTVKVIPQVTFQNPNYGQAYVIFNTRNEASRAVQEMDEKCLILSDGRPVCAKLGMLEIPQRAPKFVGHLKIEKARSLAVRLEQKKAVSTSHCSQPNTIEYELALDWLLLQEKYQRAKEKIFKKQEALLRAFMRKYRDK